MSGHDPACQSFARKHAFRAYRVAALQPVVDRGLCYRVAGQSSQRIRYQRLRADDLNDAVDRIDRGEADVCVCIHQSMMY